MTVIDKGPVSAATLPRAPQRGAVWLEPPDWQLVTVTPAYAPLLARLHQRNGDHFRDRKSVV